MQLTTAHLDTLKAWLTTGPGAGLQDEEARAALNSAAAPDFFVYWSAVPVELVLDKINYANYTPNDDPSQANATAAQVWENRAMLIQLKQINLQLLLQGRGTFDATKTTQRTGLRDATESLPSGTNGNNRVGGWLNIEPVLARKATVGEKLFASGGGNGSTAVLAANLGVGFDGSLCEGQVTAENVNDARARP